MLCDGCLLPNGACQLRGTNQQNNNICGSNGQMCMSCSGATPICDNGVCVAAPVVVGSACVSDAVCRSSLGPGAVCKQQNLNGAITYSAGYCSIQDCVSPTGAVLCPLASTCIRVPLIFSEERTFCVATGCATGSCRPGYTCFSLGGPTTACLPSDFGSPALTYDTIATLHAACTTNAECRSPGGLPGAPYAGGFCSTEVFVSPDGGLVVNPDGGLAYTGNPGGQCQRACRIDDDCTSDSFQNLDAGICLSVSSTEAWCFKGCPSPLGGQSTCRSGYVCEQLFLRDGGVLSTGYCNSRCDVPGSGCRDFADGGARPCLPTGYCAP